MLFGKRPRHVKRILIVEDEPLTAFDTETMLSEAGYEVAATVDTFDDALAALDREEAGIDLVVSDVRLNSDKSGVELAAEAKSRGIPVLFVTGYPPPNAAELALATLTKPYNDRSLKGALKAVEQLIGGEKPKSTKGLQIY